MKRLLAVSILVLGACTTVSNGPMQRIAVDSEPRGAAVEVKNCGAMATKTATTPAVIWVSRRSTQCRLVFRKPYYEEQEVRLTRHTSRGMNSYGTGADIILDNTAPSDALVVGAALMLPSLAVDAASGSMFELQPNYVAPELIAKNQDWRAGVPRAADERPARPPN